MAKNTFKLQHPDGRVFNINNSMRKTVEALLSAGDYDGLEKLAMSKAKSGIHIKESKKGTFTAAATKRGKGVQEFASQVLANKENYSPAMVKKANFARNAAKWNKAEDGMQMGQDQQMQQMQQIAQMVAQALQQGADPNQILQMLVQQGVPQEVAQQVIQMVMQQMQGQQQPEMEQAEMAQPEMQEAPPMGYGGYMKKGGMIKRADGSYSRRGLWDNIRANKGSGKKPTKAMLAQEKKIRAAEKAEDGMQMQQPMEQGAPEQQIQQLMAMVAQALQQGTSPEQVMQMLVQQGVPQEVAQQVIAQVMQSMQQEQPQQEQMLMEQMPQGAMGMRIKKAGLGVGLDGTNPNERAMRGENSNIVEDIMRLQQFPINTPNATFPSQEMLLAKFPLRTRARLADNYTAPELNTKDYNTQASKDTSRRQASKDELSKLALWNLPYYTQMATWGGRDLKDLEDAYNKGLIDEDTYKKHKRGDKTLMAGGIMGQAMQSGQGIAGIVSKATNDARVRSWESGVMANEMADDAETRARKRTGDDSQLGGGTNLPMTKLGGKIKPCAECGHRMAYGGKLGFIAEHGVELPMHGRDLMSNNANVIVEGPGNRAEVGESIHDPNTGTVTNTRGLPTHEQQDAGLAEEQAYKVGEGGTILPQGLGITMGQVKDLFGHLPGVVEKLSVKYPYDDDMVSWGEIGNTQNTAPETMKIKKITKLGAQELLDIESAMNKQIKIKGKNEPRQSNPTLTSIGKTTAKLNTSKVDRDIAQYKQEAEAINQMVGQKVNSLKNIMDEKTRIHDEIFGVFDHLKTDLQAYGPEAAQDGMEKSEYGSRILPYADGGKRVKTIEELQQEYQKIKTDKSLSTEQQIRKLAKIKDQIVNLGIKGSANQAKLDELEEERLKLIGSKYKYYTGNDIIDNPTDVFTSVPQYKRYNRLIDKINRLEGKQERYTRPAPNVNATVAASSSPTTASPVNTTSPSVVSSPPSTVGTTTSSIPNVAPGMRNPYDPNNLPQGYATPEHLRKTIDAAIAAGVPKEAFEYVPAGSKDEAKLLAKSYQEGMLRHNPNLINNLLQSGAINFSNFHVEALKKKYGLKDVSEKDLIGYYSQHPDEALKLFYESVPGYRGFEHEDKAFADETEYKNFIAGTKDLGGGFYWDPKNPGQQGFPTIYRAINPKKATTVAEDPAKGEDKDVQIFKAGSSPGVTRRGLPYYMESLHPAQLASELYQLATPIQGVPTIEDLGAKRALAISNKPRYRDTQPFSNYARRATLAQTRGVGMDPVKQAQMANAYANEYEARDKASGDKYNADAQIQAAYDQMQAELMQRAGASKAQALDTAAQRTATRDWKNTAMNANLLGSMGQKYMQKQLENRKAALYQDMVPNYRLNPFTWGVNFAGGSSPLQASVTDNNPAERDWTEGGKYDVTMEFDPATGQPTKISRKPIKGKYGGKVKLPSKSVKKMR